MKIFAVICTKTKELKEVTNALLHTLSSFGIETKVMVNQKSIFDGYKKGLEKCEAKDSDIVIFCHDDIELLDSKPEFIAKIAKCVETNVGIVGPAGTTCLSTNAVWWDHAHWKAGYHSGSVFHRKEGEVYDTTYGVHRRVVALDGLFLAATKKTWESVGLEKPDYFEGNWDFYDIHYTVKCHNMGLHNHAIPIKIIHHSAGELVGRDSWHKNRESFIQHTKLPIFSC